MINQSAHNVVEMEHELPLGWSVSILKNLVDSKRKIRYGIVQPGKYDPTGRFMIRGQDYSNGWANPASLFRVSESIEKKYRNARLKTGDIILTIVGAGTGTVAIVPSWLDGSNCTQTTARIAIDPSKADSLYCYYYLESSKGQKLTYRYIKGGAQPGLNCGDIEKYKIILPPISEQRSIAAVLSDMDRAINTNNQLIAQKELRKKWLMQVLLTGKKRLKGFDEPWSEVQIKDVAEEVSIRNKDDNDLTVLSCTKYDGLVPSLEYFGRKIYSDNLTTYKIVPKNHFAYATNHIEEGSLGYNNYPYAALISPMYTIFKTQNDIDDAFFYKLLKSHRLIYQYNARMEGSINRRGGLRWNGFSTIRIKLPSPEEQAAIARILTAADKEIDLLKEKTTKLMEQKKWMMQVLLTGKKRLKV